MNIGYVGAFWTAMVAMGGSLNFSTVAITYLTANAAGSFIPSPGGIGTVETALTSGLTVAGVSSSVAIATALLYRLVTFYWAHPVWVAGHEVHGEEGSDLSVSFPGLGPEAGDVRRIRASLHVPWWHPTCVTPRTHTLWGSRKV